MLTSTNIRVVICSSAYLMTVYSALHGIDLLSYSLLIFAGFCLTMTATATLHGAAHKSIKPKWLARPIGEISALFQLSGFAEWTVVHVFHHVFTDEPELDPHPPKGKTYWQYVRDMRTQVGGVTTNHYLKQWGKTEESIKNWTRYIKFTRISQSFRVLFWLSLLDMKTFVFLFSTSVVIKMFHMAWFNYATHVTEGDGVKIINLDHGIFYKFVNFIAFGLYFHGNHHTNPSLFDARNFTEKVKTNIKDPVQRDAA
jgi:stearoyl-CoA desaturase (delta-9 desaturase)